MRHARILFSASRWLVLVLAAVVLSNSLRESGLYLGHPTRLPAGFRERLIVGGLDHPASIAVAPDGRIFVVEQRGRIRIVQNDVLLAEPFLALETAWSLGQGMFHVAFDPDFGENHWVYVYYFAPGRHDRLVRVTAEGNTALPGSVRTIWDSGPVSRPVGHQGGSPIFDENGFIYFGTGDSDVGDHAQLLDSPHGKVMRVTREGAPAPGNPFLNTPGALPEIFAYGFRNAYSLVRDPVTGTILVNDVGQDSYEEINRLVPGGNYGWNVCEGTCAPARSGMQDPIVVYPHGLGTGAGCAVMGGDFYHPAQRQFPAEYWDKYFYADLCNGWIRTLNPGDNSISLFATGLVHPEDVNVGAEGALYYLSRGLSPDFYSSDNPGQLWRIEYQLPDVNK